VFPLSPFDDLQESPSCPYYLDGRYGQIYGCTFDEPTKQMVVTFFDTSATLAFDWGDVAAT
jgi:hypothetical protein